MIESARLRHRAFTHDDVPLLSRWLRAPETVQSSLTQVVPDELAVRRFTEWAVSRTAADGPHFRILERREDGAAIGFAGLKRVDDWPSLAVPPEGDADIEVGYVIDAQWWGRGYATEAAAAALREGFERMALDAIAARTRPDNLRSIAVMLRNQMTFVQNETIGGHEAVRYCISRDAWLARRARGA